MALLEVEDLEIAFPTFEGVIHAVNGISVKLEANEMLGLVGETGSGKSVLARAMLGQVLSPGKVVKGSVRLDGQDLLTMDEIALQKIRGRDIGLVVTSPKGQLNPLITIGEQISNVYRAHFPVSRAEGHEKAIEMLKSVGIPDPKRRAAAYPHQLSGGMAQRVLIAMALSCDPSVLIADDATNGLDVTVQRQVLLLIRDLIRKRNSAAVFVTHDLGIVAQFCQKVAILYGGKIVEFASIKDFFAAPKHPYSLSLLRSLRETSTSYESITMQGPGFDRWQTPKGCSLHDSCPLSIERCREEEPALLPAGGDHRVRCHVRSAA